MDSRYVLIDQLLVLAVSDSGNLRCFLQSRAPIPAKLPKEDVHAFAESVAERLHFEPGDSMEALVRKLGGRISLRNKEIGGYNTSESIRVEPDRTFTVYVSTITSAERDRFTIAHELGHLFLHFPIVQERHAGAVMVATRWVNDTDPEQRRAEWEANWFAAAFLMPKEEFVSVFQRKHRSVAATASYFGVSAHAAEVRAKTLGLI